MFGTPFTCVSIGAATDCSMVAASAPGNVADTTTEGGVICGNRATGSSRKAMRPASVMTIASTVAKIGRSLKKLLTKRGGPGGRFYPYWPAGLELLGAVDDHHIARRQALLDHPITSLLRAHLDVALPCRAGAVHDPNIVLVLQDLHRAR